MATKKLREKEVEKYLRDQVKERGGIAYKFVSPGRRSVPDRIVVLPDVPTFFVEAKAPGEVLTDAQGREHERIKAAGGITTWVDTYEAVDTLLFVMCGR